MKITNDQIQAAYDTAKKRGKITDTTTVAHQVLYVVGECVEFVEAWRKGLKYPQTYYCDIRELLIELADKGADDRMSFMYSIRVKNTVEDELADIWISLLTLAGVMGMSDFNTGTDYKISTVEEEVCTLINDITETVYNSAKVYHVVDSFNSVSQLAKHLNIDLELHVRAKMAYNAVRED